MVLKWQTPSHRLRYEYRNRQLHGLEHTYIVFMKKIPEISNSKNELFFYHSLTITYGRLEYRIDCKHTHVVAITRVSIVVVHARVKHVEDQVSVTA